MDSRKAGETHLTSQIHLFGLHELRIRLTTVYFSLLPSMNDKSTHDLEIAFQTVRDALSAIYRENNRDFTTTGGRIRALDRIEHANPFEQQAVLVSLYGERKRRQEQARKQGELQPRRIALHGMMACAYLDLRPESNEYVQKRQRLQDKCDVGQI
jgi:hypothetical protein